jgi:heme A synthase
VRLRIYHPILAILTGIYLFLAGRSIAAARPGIGVLVFYRAIVYLVIIQLVAGFVNVLLNVPVWPVWMQLIHLLLADLLWITFILLSAAALSQPVPAAEPTQPAAQIGD